MTTARSFEGVVLKTERLILRPLLPDDAEALFRIFSDPQVMRYWSTTPWASVERAEQMIAQDMKAMPTGEHLRLAVVVAATDALAGMCTLFAIQAQCRRAEVGYALGRAFWRKGYMHEALTALLDFGFDTLDLNRVEADIDPRNQASARVLERLGFRKEGHLRQRWIVAGEVSDTGFYGLLRADRDQRKPT